MLDRTSINMGNRSQTVALNTPSHGMIQRSNPKSFFIRFAKGSPLEGSIFNTKGHQSCLMKKDSWDELKPDPDNKVDVLQVMVFGDIEYLCEVVRVDDLVDET